MPLRSPSAPGFTVRVPDESRANAPGKGFANVERGSAVLGFVSGALGFVVFLVAERPVSAVAFCAGAVGAAISGTVYVWRARDSSGTRRFTRRARAATLGTLAAAAVGASAAVAVPATRPVLTHDLFGFPDIRKDVSIEQITVAETSTARIARVTITNSGTTDYLVTMLGVKTSFNSNVDLHGCDLEPERFRIGERLRVGSDRAGQRAVVGTANDARLGDAAAVPVTGTLSHHCETGVLDLAFPAAVRLPAGDSATVLLEIPLTLNVTDVTGRTTAVEIVLPADDPLSTASMRAAATFAITVRVGKDRVPVTREHTLPARLDLLPPPSPVATP